MNKFALCSAAAVAAAALAAGSASAQVRTVDINLAGWQAAGGFANAGNTNTSITLDRTGLPAEPLEVIAVDYIDLAFATSNESWLRELILSVNDNVDINRFWDHRPSTTAAPGSFSGSGTFPNPALFGSGPFVVSAGDVLYIEVYDSFDDPGIDATISQGTLRITYQAIPEPAALGLLAGGLPLVMRRRRA
ncbi:MAG: hypothetical protein ACK4PI_09350 [Tepidisphaerales bacterium]